jgi:hypothetical protein
MINYTTTNQAITALNTSLDTILDNKGVLEHAATDGKKTALTLVTEAFDILTANQNVFTQARAKALIAQYNTISGGKFNKKLTQLYLDIGELAKKAGILKTTHSYIDSSTKSACSSTVGEMIKIFDEIKASAETIKQAHITVTEGLSTDKTSTAKAA